MLNRSVWINGLCLWAGLAMAETPVIDLGEKLPPAAASREAPLTLPTITTVGSRIERPGARLPESIAVVSQRELEISQASDLGEALGSLPGVAVEGGPRSGGQFLNVRGLSGPRVLLIVDGARQNFLGGHRSSLLVDPELLKQVELLRGPASALWGSDALGGVVALSTKDADDLLAPGQGLGGRLRLGYESAAGEQLGSLIGAARRGELEAVASLLWREADSYQRGDGAIEPYTGAGVDSHLLKLAWRPGGGAHGLRLSRQAFGRDSLAPSNPSSRIDDTNPLIDRRNEALYSVLRYDFDGQAGRRLRHAQFNLYRDELALREDRVDEPRADRTAFVTDGAHGHLSLQLDPLRERWLTLGLDGFSDDAKASRDGAARPQYPDAERQMLGLFAQLEWSFGRLSLVPGLRYDRYRAASRQDDSAPVAAAAISPKLGLIWRAAPGLRLRAAANSAFRAPGLVEIYAAGQHFLGNDFTPNPSLAPEKARNLELGASWHWPPRAPWLNLEASLYQNTVEDYIELFVTVESQVPAPQCLAPRPPPGCVNTGESGLIDPTVPPVFVGGSTTSRNLPRARIRGGELALNLRAGLWRAHLGATALRGRNVADGAPLLSIPADRLRVSLSVLPLADLEISLSHSHHFRQARVPQTEDEDGRPVNVIPITPAYGVWNLSLFWEPLTDGWLGLREPRLVAGIDNLGDRAYRHHLNVLESPGRNLRLGLSAAF